MNRLPLRKVTDEEIEKFSRSGVVHLSGIFDEEWVEFVTEAVERRLINQDDSCVNNASSQDKKGGFLMGKALRLYDSSFLRFAFESPAKFVIRNLLRADRKINLLDDQLFVKEPQSQIPTPWHQDLSFWAVEGTQLCSMWMALDSIDLENGGLEFIRGSHKWQVQYKAHGISYDSSMIDPKHADLPLIEENRSDYDIVSYSMKPGDIVVFHALTLHSAGENKSTKIRRRAYCSRWAGDDVVYSPRPYSSPRHLQIGRAANLQVGNSIDCFYYPQVWNKNLFIGGSK